MSNISLRKVLTYKGIVIDPEDYGMLQAAIMREVTTPYATSLPNKHHWIKAEREIIRNETIKGTPLSIISQMIGVPEKIVRWQRNYMKRHGMLDKKAKKSKSLRYWTPDQKEKFANLWNNRVSPKKIAIEMSEVGLNRTYVSSVAYYLREVKGLPLIKRAHREAEQLSLEI